MTCEEATSIIHLDRPGERSESDERELHTHLRTCERCRAEADLVRHRSDRMEALRMSGVPQPNVARETARILHAVDTEPVPPDLLGWLLDLAGRRSIRVAYGLASCLLLVALSVQLAGDVAPPPPTVVRTGPYLTYRVDASHLERLKTIPLPPAVEQTLSEAVPGRIRSEDVARTARLAGQAVLYSMNFTDDQKRLASAIITTLIQTSEPTVRFGFIGG